MVGIKNYAIPLYINPEYKIDRGGNIYNPKGRPISKTPFYPKEKRLPILRVSIVTNGVRKFYDAKRLVITAFKPKPKYKKATCIINIDNNFFNIKANNLSWVTLWKAKRHNDISVLKSKHKSKPTMEFNGAF